MPPSFYVPRHKDEFALRVPTTEFDIETWKGDIGKGIKSLDDRFQNVYDRVSVVEMGYAGRVEIDAVDDAWPMYGR